MEAERRKRSKHRKGSVECKANVGRERHGKGQASELHCSVNSHSYKVSFELLLKVDNCLKGKTFNLRQQLSYLLHLPGFWLVYGCVQ